MMAELKQKYEKRRGFGFHMKMWKWILDVGYWMLETGCWILDIGSGWKLNVVGLKQGKIKIGERW